MALAIDHRLLTDAELMDECLLNGTEVEKRLANYLYRLHDRIVQLEEEKEERW